MTSGAPSEHKPIDSDATSRNQRVTSVVLAILAAGITQCFRFETQSHLGLVFAELGLVILCVALLFRMSRRFPGGNMNMPGSLQALLALLIVLPILVQFVSRPLFGAGDTAEIIMLLCMQNAALGAAVLAQWRRAGGISFLLSGFLVLFIIIITASRVAYVLAALFGLAGMWWLMNAYWDRLQGRFAAETTRQVPVRTGAVLATLFVLTGGVALASLTVSSDTFVLPGFMPSSGGNRGSDPYARAGVGDGDMLVAAKDQAMTFGAVESELFLESELPSLYDVFNDMYGDPKKVRKSQKAISLRPEDSTEFEKDPALSKQSGREFSTVRRKARRWRESLKDRDATAMFYVVGKTPLHLALANYDHFDGTEWSSQQEDTVGPKMSMKNVDGEPWIVAPRSCSYPIFSGTDQHAVKIINLRTIRIPSPAQLNAWHIDRVDRPDFFGWTDDGILEMRGREFVPQLTVVNLNSHRMNLTPLRDRQPTKFSAGAEMAPYLALPDSVDQDHISEIAHRWTMDVPAGWQQVEAVVEHLRTDFEHDPQVTAPEDCEDTVSHFLAARRGPDYMFASTAAVMLRMLGYPTRVVSGFYADPQDYDRQSRQTIVEDEDAHVWAEVCVDDRTWIPIEPTPGYEPPLTVLSWSQQLAKTTGVIFQWVQANLLLSTVLLGFGIGLIVFRRAVFDFASYAFWMAVSFGSSRRRILWTIRMLEWRSWMAGHSRPQSRTLRQWYEPMAGNAAPEAAESLRSLMTLADWALYRPTHPSEKQWPCTDREIVQRCHCVGRLWTSRHIGRQTQTG